MPPVGPNNNLPHNSMHKHCSSNLGMTKKSRNKSKQWIAAFWKIWNKVAERVRSVTHEHATTHTHTHIHTCTPMYIVYAQINCNICLFGLLKYIHCMGACMCVCVGEKCGNVTNDINCCTAVNRCGYFCLYCHVTRCCFDVACSYSK